MPAYRSFFYYSSAGFSVVELLIVMGILGTLFGLTMVDLTNLLPRTNLSSATEQISLDLKDQQLKSMVGDGEGRDSADQYGIYFQINQYVLFHGASYSAGQADNVTIDLGEEFQMTPDLPSRTILFEQVSGEVVNFNASDSSILVTNTANNEAKTVRINKFGVVTEN